MLNVLAENYELRIVHIQHHHIIQTKILIIIVQNIAQEKWGQVLFALKGPFNSPFLDKDKKIRPN